MVIADPNTGLVERARHGDQEAFTQLVEPYQRELQLHCYRIVGSMHDGEDVLQETLLAAWRGLSGFKGRSSFRTWLYRVATHRCLNALRSRRRMLVEDTRMSGPELPEPSRLGEVPWLEPYPDALIDNLTDGLPGPEAQYEAREAVSLAFVTALQLLPPRQRAVLILRDALGFHASEVAQILQSTEQSVNSALKRARASMNSRQPLLRLEPSPMPDSPAERELVERFTTAWENQDLEGVVALLTDDVLLAMPPLSLEYVGQDLARRFLSVTVAMQGPKPRLLATRANGQPAFGLYIRDPHARVAHGIGLLALTLCGGRVSAITGFDKSVLKYFRLPTTIPDR